MFKTLALVIKKSNYRETDRILTILTPLLGKKRVVARGIRKPLSKMCGHLDSLMLSKVIILSKDRDMPTVTSSQLIEPYENIRSSLDKTRQAMAVLRLSEKVFLEDAEQEIFFNDVVEVLRSINQSQNVETMWLRYLARLLMWLGLLDDKHRCEKCGRDLVDFYRVSYNRASYCKGCLPDVAVGDYVDEKTHKLIRIIISKDRDFVSKIIVDAPTLRSAENFLLKEFENMIGSDYAKYKIIT